MPLVIKHTVNSIAFFKGEKDLVSKIFDIVCKIMLKCKNSELEN